MPTVATNGVDIAYETWGDPDAAVVLLLPGAGRQLVEWDPAFVAGIVAAGYRVVAIDQRDSGLSTHFEGKAPLARLRTKRSMDLDAPAARAASDLPYRLDDLAIDAVGVLDGLEIDAAHAVGFSLGGAVAQQMAVHHQDRLLSLTSVMASTGDPDVGQPDAVGRRVLLRSPPRDSESAVPVILETRRLVGGGEVDFDEGHERARIESAVARSYDPAGTGRQLAALWAAGDRTGQIATITVPTLVIHGSTDPLVDVSGGLATAVAIPGARLVIVEGMGHVLARPFVPRIVEELLEHFVGAESADG